VREDDGHAPGLRSHGLDHVLHEGVVAALRGRHAGEVPAIGIAGPNLVTPFLQGEGRIGDDAVEGGEVVAGVERRVPQGVAAHDLEIRGPVQEEVDAGDGGGGEILLLTVELTPKRADITAGLLHMMDGLKQHATGAAGGIVNGLALSGIEDVHHEPHHGARGVELAGLLVRGVGEFLDQVFIRLPSTSALAAAFPSESREKCSMRSLSRACPDRRSLFVHCASPKMP
jgi:hypothetical protein